MIFLQKKFKKHLVESAKVPNFALANGKQRHPQAKRTLSYGVMVAHRILVPLVRVRVLLRQPKPLEAHASGGLILLPAARLSA